MLNCFLMRWTVLSMIIWSDIRFVDISSICTDIDPFLFFGHESEMILITRSAPIVEFNQTTISNNIVYSITLSDSWFFLCDAKHPFSQYSSYKMSSSLKLQVYVEDLTPQRKKFNCRTVLLWTTYIQLVWFKWKWYEKYNFFSRKTVASWVQKQKSRNYMDAVVGKCSNCKE